MKLQDHPALTGTPPSVGELPILQQPLKKSSKLLLTFAVLTSLSLFSGCQKNQTQEQTSRYEAKIVMVDFWASWCWNCLDTLKWLDKIQDKYPPEDQLLKILTINLDAEQHKMTDFIAKHNLQDLHANWDPQGVNMEKFGVRVLPSLVIKYQGETRIFEGDNSGYKEYLEQILSTSKLVAL